MLMNLLRRNGNEVCSILFIALVAVLLALAITSPLAQAPAADRELFRYIGMLISKGYVPYINVFDNKPPVIYFLAATGWWGLWLINNISIGLSAVIFYLFCKARLKHPLSCSLIYVILLHFPVIDGGGLTYEFTAALSMITACVSLSKKPCFLLLGVLCSMVFFTQVNDILALAPLIAYAVISQSCFVMTNRLLRLLRYSVQFLLGFVLFASIIFGYFAYHHAVKAFINDAFIFNLSIYVPHTNHFGFFETVCNYLHAAKAVYLLPFMLILIPANLLFLFKKDADRDLKNWTLLLLLSFILNGISISLSGWFFNVYYLNTVVYLSLYLAVFLKFLNSVKLNRSIKFFLPILILLCLILCLHTERHSISKFTDFIRHPGRPTAYENAVAPYESLVSDVKGRDGQLYIYRRYGLAEAIYTDLKIKSPSLWVYTYFWDWYPFWDPDNVIFERIIANINQQRTKYIMDFSLSKPMSRAAATKAWQTMLTEHYQKTKPLYCSADGDQPKLCGWLYVRKAAGAPILRQSLS